MNGSAPARTLPELCAANAAATPDALALVDDLAGRRTYRELHADALALARGLRALGARPDETVALLAPNSVDWVATAVAAHLLAAPLAAFHTWVKPRELDFLLDHSEAATLVIAARVGDHDLLEPLRAIAPEVWEGKPDSWRSARFPKLRRVVVLGRDTADVAGARSSTEVRDAGWDGAGEPPAREEDAAFVLYTSGSTAEPKAVPLVHGHLVENGFQIGERMGLASSDRVWLGSPLFWSFGAANALIASFTHRSPLVLQQRFEAESGAAQIAEHGCTAAYLLPALAHAFFEVPGVQEAFRTVRTGLTIGRPGEVERIARDLGVEEICNIYGSTETYGNCCVTPHDMPLERRLRCQGPPLAGNRVRIVDPVGGEELPAGTAGTIEVQGRVMPGYWKNPQLNRTTFTEDGWYRTGDVGSLDDEGNVNFVTRDTDMIKTSGINVSPAEIETLIAADARVAEAAVVGVEDPQRGEVVAAVVQPAPGAEVSADDVVALCRRELASYKTPRLVRVVDEFPHTATGKVSRRELSALLQEAAR